MKIVEALRKIERENFVLDGELVVSVNGKVSFDHLIMRLTQSGARAKKLASEYPAVLFLFDLLADEDGLMVSQPLSERRERLDAFAERFPGNNAKVQLSPATRDIAVARKWFELAGDSLDGIVAKRVDLPYHSGLSRGMQKIKKRRTVDCVVGGVIAKSGAVSHLLLGLYDKEGLLQFVGAAPLRQLDGKKMARELDDLIEAPGFTGKKPGEVKTQFGHRAGEWQPLRSELVAEVQFDHFTGDRFRHGAKFIRWRPEKEPGACSMGQVR
ncbi:MAG: ATP-dependent DNA ligase [Blastocatellia bacterium]